MANFKKIKTKFEKLIPIVTLSIVIVGLFSFNVQALEKSASSKHLKKAIFLRESGDSKAAIEVLNSLKLNFHDHKRVNFELLINYIKLEDFIKGYVILRHLKTLNLSLDEKKKIVVLQKHINSTNSSRITRKNSSLVSLSAFTGVDKFNTIRSLYGFIDLGGIEDIEPINEYDDGYLNERNNDDELNDKVSYIAHQIKLEYRYKSDNQFSFNKTPSVFNWKNTLTYYQKNDISNRDDNQRYRQYKLDSSFQILQTNGWLFDLRLRNRHHELDNKKILAEHGVQLSASIPIDQKSRIKIGVEKRNQSFTNSIDFLNANVLTPWIEYTIKFRDNYKFYIGGRYRKNKAKDEFYTYKNINYYTSFHYYTADKISAFITYNDNTLDFELDDPNLVNWSRETKFSVAFGSKYQFDESLSFGIKAHFVTNTAKLNNNDFNDIAHITKKWQRIEAFVNYRF